MSRRHVTIEDVVDEDNQQQNSTGFSELDLNTINQDASQRQAWVKKKNTHTHIAFFFYHAHILYHRMKWTL